MAEQTNAVIYHTLQPIQEMLVEPTRRFDAVDCRSQLTSIGIGFAGHTDIRHDQVDTRMAELKAHFGTLDELMRCVGYLE